MAGFPGRCAREARTIASRSSTRLHRPRCFHSSTPALEADGSSSSKGDKPQGIAFGSQAAFNAVKNNQSNTSPAATQSSPSALSQSTPAAARSSGAPFIRLPPKPAGTNSFRRTDDVNVQSKPDGGNLFRRTADVGSPGTAPRFATRRPPPADGAPSAGTRPQGERPTYQRGTGGPRRGGAVRGRGGSRTARPPKSKGRGGRTSSGPRSSVPTQFLEYEDYMRGRYNSNHFHEGVMDAAHDAYAARAEEELQGQAFVPSVSNATFLGQGPTTTTSGNGSGELLHRLLSRGTMPLAPPNTSFPTQKAQDLLSGKTVFFHSDEEARNVQEQIKAIRYADLAKHIQSLGPDSKMPKNIGHDLLSFGDIKIETIKEEDRAAVDGAWLAGTYVAPGEGAGKNASEALRTVWNYVARNETYLTDSQKTLAKKVASLVPSKALPAKAGSGGAKAKQRAAA